MSIMWQMQNQVRIRAMNLACKILSWNKTFLLKGTKILFVSSDYSFLYLS